MAGFGLLLGRTLGASPTAMAAGEYPIAANYTGVLAMGDLVILSSGNIQEASGNSAGNIGEAVRPFGIFAGCRYVQDGEQVFMPAWDGLAGRSRIFATILPLNDRLFRVKGDSSITWTAANIGTTRNLIWAAPVTGRMGQSRVTLGAANAEGHALIHALWSAPGNGYTAAGVTEPEFLVEVTKTAGGLNVPYSVT